jgi:predicted cation transporter
MNPLKQLEAAPRNLILYFLGLLGAVVDDYTLVTLTLFCVLLGFTVSSALIGLVAFFGGYFLLRLTANVSEAIGANAQAKTQNAQATMQIAAAIVQNTPQTPQAPEL